MPITRGSLPRRGLLEIKPFVGFEVLLSTYYVQCCSRFWGSKGEQDTSVSRRCSLGHGRCCPAPTSPASQCLPDQHPEDGRVASLMRWAGQKRDLRREEVVGLGRAQQVLHTDGPSRPCLHSVCGCRALGARDPRRGQEGLWVGRLGGCQDRRLWTFRAGHPGRWQPLRPPSAGLERSENRRNSKIPTKGLPVDTNSLRLLSPLPPSAGALAVLHPPG